MEELPAHLFEYFLWAKLLEHYLALVASHSCTLVILLGRLIVHGS